MRCALGPGRAGEMPDERGRDVRVLAVHPVETAEDVEEADRAAVPSGTVERRSSTTLARRSCMTRKRRSALSLACTNTVPAATPARVAMAWVVVASYPTVVKSFQAAARIRSRVATLCRRPRRCRRRGPRYLTCHGREQNMTALTEIKREH